MVRRIVKKILPINNPYDKRIVYVVDKTFHFFSKKRAEEWVNKYTSTGRRK